MDAVVLFSGGVDSTYIVARIADRYDRLTLLTYRTPGMANVGFSARSARQLIGLFGDRIDHRIVDIRSFVKKVRGGAMRCMTANMEYGFHYSWCLGCKVCMHVNTIDFCRENGVNVVLDGNNLYDVHALEQREDVIGIFRRLYTERGIEYASPFYDEGGELPRRGRLVAAMRHLTLLKDSTAARVAHCADLGIDFGRGIGSQYRKTQPSCVISPFFNGARVFLTLLQGERRDGYLRYVEDTAERGLVETGLEPLAPGEPVAG